MAPPIAYHSHRPFAPTSFPSTVNAQSNPSGAWTRLDSRTVMSAASQGVDVPALQVGLRAHQVLAVEQQVKPAVAVERGTDRPRRRTGPDQFALDVATRRNDDVVDLPGTLRRDDHVRATAVVDQDFDAIAGRLERQQLEDGAEFDIRWRPCLDDRRFACATRQEHAQAGQQRARQPHSTLARTVLNSSITGVCRGPASTRIGSDSTNGQPRPLSIPRSASVADLAFSNEFSMPAAASMTSA